MAPSSFPSFSSPPDNNNVNSVDEIDTDYETLPPTASIGAHMIAGALAGITEHTVMYPVDSIKTRLQILVPTSPQALYTGTYHAFSRISSTEGLRTLWRGVSSVVIGAGPAHALYFATYEQCKSMAVTFSQATDEHNIAPSWAAAAGATATIVQDVIMNPFDVVKQRMQSYSGSQYHSLLHCATSIFRNEGIRAFYLSYPTTLSMSIPFHSMHFAVYEAVSTAVNPKRHYHPLSHIIAGAAAGAVASAITTPMDVAKTLLQTKGDQADPIIRKANGMMDAFKIVWSRHGFRGLWKGIIPRVLSHMPATAVCWTTYEYLKYFMTEDGNLTRVNRVSSHTN